MAAFPSLPMAALTMGLFSAWFVQLSMSAYVGYMVESLGIVSDKDHAGYMTGLLSSVFMIGRLASAYYWGVLADRYGRRPIVLFSLGSTSVFAVAFGVSETFSWALACRFFLGFFNGMTVVFPTVVAEVCGKEHEVLGMGLVTTAWSTGALVGAGLGGVLAEPATHYPEVFSEAGVFARFPYLLPNAVGGGLALLSLPLVVSLLPETLPLPAAKSVNSEKDSQPDKLSAVSLSSAGGGGRSAGGSSRRAGSEEEQHVPRRKSVPVTGSVPCYGSFTARPGNGEEAVAVPAWKKGTIAGAKKEYNEVATLPTESLATKGSRNGKGLFERRSFLRDPHVRLLLFTYGLYTFIIAGLDDVYALWALSTSPKGGLDWSTKEIGQVLLASGLMVFAYEVTVLPLLAKKDCMITTQRVMSVVLVLVYPLFPLLTHLRGTGWPLIAASLALLFTTFACCDSFYTSFTLAINSATSLERRGQLNGLASSVASVASMVGPATWSALFAFSVDRRNQHLFGLPFPIDFRFTFWLMALLRLTVACLSWDAVKQDQDEGDDHLDKERGMEVENLL